MHRYLCSACQLGQHDLCDGRQAPPEGVIGGHECVCDGRCGQRYTERRAARRLSADAARADLSASGLQSASRPRIVGL